MAPAHSRLRVLSVGGNAVSAFLSWRLQATNACDVTLVWKANYQSVAQYGVSFKSKLFGNERFKPRFVVQNPEDAAGREIAYDYVLLCVKALPDVYNLADIIQSVVTPQHTCIIVNTTNTLGVEKQLQERFPTNVVLSLVSAADLVQLGASEFEHSGSTDIWVGPASNDSKIPKSIQRDMSEALAMTLTTGQVDCKVSDNIRQQQFERMIGPIAFYPLSVIFDNPDLKDLLQKPGVRELVSDVVGELMNIAKTVNCEFDANFRQKVIDNMIEPTTDPNTMYQDFQARRPMEVETYLGSPGKIAKEAGVLTPHINTLYTILRNINTTNKDRPPVSQAATPTVANQPPPTARMSANPPPRPMPGPMNGPMNGNSRPMRGGPNGMMPPPGRRGPPISNKFRGGSNGYPRGQQPLSRKQSFDENNLDEFSHVVLYDDAGDESGGAHESSLRERELMLREREVRLRQQEMAMRRGVGGRKPSQAHNQDYMDDDDDDDDGDFFDSRGMPPVDADNFDMMSVTSRRTKRAPSQNQLRRNPYDGAGMPMRPMSHSRPQMNRNRTSAQLMNDMPSLGENILDNAMMGFSSNRYGAVDRKEMQVESRTNSLTASRLHEMGGPGPYPAPNRRASRSPGNPLSPAGPMGPMGNMGPMGRGPGRPSPPNGHGPYMQGPGPNNRPSPPNVQAPMPRYPPGQGNMIQPHQIEHQQQHQTGVSKLYPSKGPTKSLTGSASASAGSGDSGSANIESEPSAHSSTSSFVPRTMIQA